MAGPSQNDYYQAASYYHDNGKDLKQALEWIKMANAENPRFWQVRREALILADMGNYPAAIQAAEKSKSLAKEANNDDYVRMNEKSIAEWTQKKPNNKAKSPKTKSDSKS
jgi:tetratricopeptide (TPR) repeat protein